MLREYKNGNITYKPEQDENPKALQEALYIFLSAIDSIDTYNVGDEYSLSNFDTGITLYNCRLEKCYILSFTNLIKAFKDRKTLRLYAHTPDDDEREIITDWMQD